MRLFVIVILSTLAGAGIARAQSTDASKGYVEAVAQSSFGTVTSQSYGGEFGVTVRPNLQIFVEAGQTRNAATAAFTTAAQQIQGFLSQDNSGVGLLAKKPITFGAAGLRFLIPLSNPSLVPYVLAAGGVARIKQDVTFSINGTDVTANLAQYGVVLGTDLSGTETTGLAEIGAGLAWSPWRQLVIDFQYRYARIFASDQGINLNRAGVGIGVRF
jgi:opacity protein-like surface antigen